MNGTKKLQHKKSRKSIFLATTALEEFWDTSKPIVFLGEWCKRYHRRAIWEKLNAIVLPSHFNDTEKVYAAYLYSSDLFERTLKVVSNVLNNIHGKDYSERYWRMVIGTWLFLFIDSLYDRYISIKTAINEYPDLDTIVLDKESFITPVTTLMYYKLLEDDLYNLQIYSILLNKLLNKECKYIRKDFSLNNNTAFVYPTYQKRFFIYLKKKIRKCLYLFYQCGFKHKTNIIAVSSYFGPIIDLILFVKTLGKYKPFVNEIYDIKPVVVDKLMRSKIKIELSCNNEFEEILTSLLPYAIPQSFIETYEIIRRTIQQKYPPPPHIILSANSIYFNEYFKQWAAYATEYGSKLVGIQHGGGYGTDLFNRFMDYEISIEYKFYTWGWDSGVSHPKFIPMPATKMIERKKSSSNNNCKKEVLFACTAMPRYLTRIQMFNNGSMSDYLKWQASFYNAVVPNIQTNITVRLFYDYGWDMYERWQNIFPDIKIENMRKPFLQSMNSCRVLICDHYSTVYLEGLAANKPTICFWDPQIIKLNQESIPYYDDLRAVGILYDTPESAAATLNRVYDDVDEWWNNIERQAILNKFCNRFARTSQHAISEWVSELQRVSNEY